MFLTLLLLINLVHEIVRDDQCDFGLIQPYKT